MLKGVLDEKVVTVGDLALCQAHRLSETFDVEEHDKTGRLGCPVDHADVVLVSCNTLLTLFTSYVCMSVYLRVCLGVCLFVSIPPLLSVALNVSISLSPSLHAGFDFSDISDHVYHEVASLGNVTRMLN